LDGCEEHASVAAFARLTLHLLSAGAPPELVEMAHRASLDEIRHARTCFALARRYGGAPLGPGPLKLDGLFSGAHASLEATLPEIAALCAEEGCVGETLGVLLASDALARARDPFVREVLTRMLDEEASHVELAWRVVSWCITQGGEPVRRAVAHAIGRGVVATRATEVRLYAGVDVDAWNEHGRVTCEQARAVAERGIREVIEPCARVLLEAGPAKPDSNVRLAQVAQPS
ncbi:MAG TPA: ferritin-like domain-containing protein, partial [Polyangiaceae bacterium]